MAGEGRATPSRMERRDVATRAGGGAWTQTERDRFIAKVREARQDAKAVTIQGGNVVKKPQLRRRIRRIRDDPAPRSRVVLSRRPMGAALASAINGVVRSGR